MVACARCQPCDVQVAFAVEAELRDWAIYHEDRHPGHVAYWDPPGDRPGKPTDPLEPEEVTGMLRDFQWD